MNLLPRCMALMRQPGVIALALASAMPLAYAGTINVPADHGTVQAAIDAAVDGDEVVVAPGTYHEHLDFLGKAITLRSGAGPEVTILDGNFDGRVVYIHSGEGRDSVLQGFTIRRGNAGNGSGVDVFESSPTIIDNIFEDNHGWGAGIEVSGYIGVSALVARNVFRNHPFCVNVVSIINRTNVEFVNNLIAGNNCDGVYTYIDTYFRPLIANNTIVRNKIGLRFVSAYDTARYQVLRNNLLYGNETGFLWYPLTQDPVRPQWRHNLVYGNGVDYKDAFGRSSPGTLESLSSGNGNLSVDPLLGGFGVGDYTPDYGSPAVDAGENAVGDFGTDLYLRPRRHDGNGDGIATIDIGAFEPRVPTPVVVLGFAPEQIALGEPTTISWSSNNAESCEARGEPWSGARPLSGSEQWSSETPSRPVFQLVCTGDKVARAKSFELIVGDVFPVEITITPDTIADDQNATLTWSAPDATSCEASGAWSGEVGPSGTRTINHMNVYAVHTYTLNCMSATGTGRASAAVTSVRKPYVWMRISPTNIKAGESTTITWTSTDTLGCAATGGPWSGDDLPPNGSVQITPQGVGFHDYLITCWGPTGSSQEEFASVQVYPADESSSAGGGGSIPWEFTMTMLITLLARRSARPAVAVCALASVLMSAPARADSQIYIYDGDGRLVQVEYGAGEKVNYPVDEIGNRTGVSKLPPPTETAAFTSATAAPAENAGSVALTIVRSGSTSAAASLTCATVPYGAATAGSDYTAVSVQLNWGIGQSGAQTCTVPLLNDTAAEPNETFRVELSNAAGFSVISPRFVTITIRDDETPATLSLTSASYMKLESGGSATISVSRTGGSVGTVTVHYATSNVTANGNDYIGADGTLTWPDGDVANKSFPVPIIDDSTPENEETFRVTLTSPTGNSNLGATTTADVRIPCNDGYNCQ